MQTGVCWWSVCAITANAWSKMDTQCKAAYHPNAKDYNYMPHTVRH